MGVRFHIISVYTLVRTQEVPSLTLIRASGLPDEKTLPDRDENHAGVPDFQTFTHRFVFPSTPSSGRESLTSVRLDPRNKRAQSVSGRMVIHGWRRRSALRLRGEGHQLQNRCMTQIHTSIHLLHQQTPTESPKRWQIIKPGSTRYPLRH